MTTVRFEPDLLPLHLLEDFARRLADDLQSTDDDEPVIEWVDNYIDVLAEALGREPTGDELGIVRRVFRERAEALWINWFEREPGVEADSLNTDVDAARANGAAGGVGDGSGSTAIRRRPTAVEAPCGTLLSN